MSQEQFDKFVAATVKMLGVDASKVTREASFADDLEADSLDVVELVMELEEVFGVEVPEDELADVKTVGQAFDLVLIDLVLGHADGLQALREFGRVAPWLPRVILSGKVDLEIIDQAERLGASAYIAKSWPVRRIVDTIHAVVAGEIDFSVRDALQPPPRLDALSERQRLVLQLLAQGKSNKEMARELSIADRTVRAHLTELFQTLGVGSRVQALLQAQRLGLVPAADVGARP